VPLNAQECHDTVTIDAPTFGLGKEATQSISVGCPQESHVVRWLLDPEKPGKWVIAIETKEDREVVPVTVTSALGFPATWSQAGAIFAGAATVLLGVLGLIFRRPTRAVGNMSGTSENANLRKVREFHF
jgi:hypothetical protein